MSKPLTFIVGVAVGLLGIPFFALGQYRQRTIPPTFVDWAAAICEESMTRVANHYLTHCTCSTNP